MKDILIIIDLQKGFTQNLRTNNLVKNIKNLLEKDIFDIVIATRFLNCDNSIYEKIFDWKYLKDEDERKLEPVVEEYADYIYDKYIYNCVDTNFLQRLCQLNDGQYPEKVFIAGVDTDCCVLTTAVGLFEHNIRPVVLAKYCDSNGGGQSHEAGLRCLRRLIGKEQIIDNEIIEKFHLCNMIM